MSDTQPELPRVLVVAHNPFSDVQNNGKTLTGFFEGWPRDRLAQLYLTLDEPSFTVCGNFYRVTDLDVLKDLLRLGSSSAGPVQQTSWQSDSKVKASLSRSRLYRLVRRVFLARLPLALMIRSVVWRRGRRDDDRLRQWLDDFAPELVFFQSSSATFAFDLVEQICADRRIPLIVETTDDYLTPGSRWSLTGRLYYRGMQRVYRRAVTRAYAVVAICQKMADEYRRRFGGSYVLAMNSVAIEETSPPTALTPDRPAVLHFAGNLGLNRWRVLASVGRALDELAERHGITAQLEIYSIDEPEPAVLEALTTSRRVRFCGAVGHDELREHRARADVVVHVESFDRRNRHVTRLSVSTKIPEYMASDRVIFAVGPGDVASIEYLRDNEIGQVVTEDSPPLVADALRALLTDEALRVRLRERAMTLAHRNHSRTATREMITRLALDAVGAVRSPVPQREDS